MTMLCSWREIIIRCDADVIELGGLFPSPSLTVLVYSHNIYLALGSHVYLTFLDRGSDGLWTVRFGIIN